MAPATRTSVTARTAREDARPHGESRRPSGGPYAGLIGTAEIAAASLADREQRFEVVARERGERDHRLGAQDARQPADVRGHHVRELLVVGHADDRDEIPPPRH